MALTKRAKYLLYICLHLIAALIGFLLLNYYQVLWSEESQLYAGILLATPFAMGGYLGISYLLEAFKQWQYGRGRDVYGEEVYEDDAGFIHLNQRAAQVNKHDWELFEIVGDAGAAIAETASEDSDAKPEDEEGFTTLFGNR